MEGSYQQAPIGLCYFDTDLRYVHINDWLATINGLTVQQHLGHRIGDILPEVAAGVESQLRQVIETAEPIIRGVAYVETPAHPGSRRHYEHSYHPDKSDDGTVVGLRCVVEDVTERKRAEAALNEAHADLERKVAERTAELQAVVTEVTDLQERLEAENTYLRSEGPVIEFDDIVGTSESLKAVLHRAKLVASTDSTVLLMGETGTGKDLLARAIHRASARRDQPLIHLNCAALPAELIESELFGHEKGAFTGAFQRKIGRFELADRGTLFLDEIGDVPAGLQVKLLRFLQEGEFERVGSTQTRKVDVRVIAATNRHLDRAMDEGSFRPDLYYRLSVFPIDLPPLRHRREDIPLLVWFFVGRLQKRLGKRIESIPVKAMEALKTHAWPGNVREVQNVLEHAIILSSGPTLALDQLVRAPEGGPARRAVDGNLQDMERAHILRILDECSWKIGGLAGAAERLGLKRTTLLSRMKKLQLQRQAQ